MYLYHLHNYKQIGQEKDYNGVCIRFLLEDYIYAENNNLDLLDLKYGTASRHELRDKLYPDFMTYRKWIELSKNYPALILSLNFDAHSWKYKSFCKKILKQFPRNKRIIVAAGNEVYEKRGSAEKVYQIALEVHQAMQEIGKFYPIAFWNEKIYTPGEREALEKLLNDSRVKEICEYFGFQSLGTSNSKVDKYVKLAKSKGFKLGDFELGTTTMKFWEIRDKFNLDKKLGIEDVVILTPFTQKFYTDYLIINQYSLEFMDGTIKDKTKLKFYIQQFKTKEEGMKIADEYKLNDKDDRVIDWIQAQLYYRGHLAKPIKFGNFDTATANAVKAWQKANGLVVNGVITKYHISVLVEQSDNSTKVFRQLMIYAS